jgi:hypothetical protein
MSACEYLVESKKTTVAVASKAARHYSSCSVSTTLQAGDNFLKKPTLQISKCHATVAVAENGRKAIANIAPARVQILSGAAFGHWTDSPQFSPYGRNIDVRFDALRIGRSRRAVEPRGVINGC